MILWKEPQNPRKLSRPRLDSFPADDRQSSTKVSSLFVAFRSDKLLYRLRCNPLRYVTLSGMYTDVESTRLACFARLSCDDSRFPMRTADHSARPATEHWILRHDLINHHCNALLSLRLQLGGRRTANNRRRGQRFQVSPDVRLTEDAEELSLERPQTNGKVGWSGSHQAALVNGAGGDAADTRQMTSVMFTMKSSDK